MTPDLLMKLLEQSNIVQLSDRVLVYYGTDDEWINIILELYGCEEFPYSDSNTLSCYGVKSLTNNRIEFIIISPADIKMFSEAIDYIMKRNLLKDPQLINASIKTTEKMMYQVYRTVRKEKDQPNK